MQRVWIMAALLSLVSAPAWGGETPSESSSDAAGASAPAPAAAPTTSDQATAPPACVSVGEAHRGWLIGGVQLDDSEQLRVRTGRNWGTPELVSGIAAAAAAVHEAFPGSPRLYVGDLSRRKGGRLKPHVSHQSGRDADIGYYFKDGRSYSWFAKARRSNLDAARTWTFIASMLKDDKVQYLFIDYHLQKSLYAYARDVAKVPEEELHRVFAYPRGWRDRTAIIRHLKGHADHMHVRFHAPESVEAAKAWIEANGAASLAPVARHHRIKRGNTLSGLARRYKVKVSELKRWNRGELGRYLRVGQKLVVGWVAPRLP